MHPVSLAELAERADQFDDCAVATPDIDVFCSSTDWILPACEALMPSRTPWLFRGTVGWVALMRGRHPRGFRYVEPLEALWGMACPLLGPRPEALVDDLARVCRERTGEWHVLVLSGIPRGSLLEAALRDRFGRMWMVRPGGSMGHCVASLAGGVDGFLARRSRNFRRGLDKAGRAAARSGVVFEPHHDDDPDALFDRALAIEARSWKGRQGVGIDTGRMRDFYRAITRRLSRRGGLRAWLARAGDRDVGYVLGGVRGATYRGLQFSYDAELEHLSVGNLLQLRQIEELCAQGFVEYDLGMEMDYKHRWAEDTRYADVHLVMRPR
jgi:hypothetical protein